MPRFAPNPARRPALLSGASSGIGAETARTLAAAGHPVALGARRVGVCEQLAAEIRDEGGEAVAHGLDVSDPDSIKAFVADASSRIGDPEILVSGAGDLGAANVHEADPDAFAREVQTHLLGAQRLISTVASGMVERRRGDIVLLGSDVARSPRPRIGGYVAAKSGVEAMGRSMQMELEGTGVRASIVRPGQTATEMGTGLDESQTEPLLEDWIKWGFARHPYSLRPSDVAAAVSTVVSAPRGVNISLLEVEPEAPLETE